MPATVGTKPPPDPPRRKVSEESKKVEPVKLADVVNEPKCEDTPAKPPAAETEVVKKATPRKRLSEERKSGSSVTDRIPKTKAQRAKGSIALNKTLEKTDSESGGKKQTSIRSIDRMSRPNTREGAAIGEARKTPVAVRSKAKVKSEGSDLKNGKKRKPWVAVVEKMSNETMDEKTVGVVEQESKEVKNEEIRPISTASNSCSFFEKLQQGVRAYFGSRNSFNLSMDEKNKKKVTEGGIRTRARVGKGVKEDQKKTKPGKVVKNKKNSSESDLWYNQFRVNSSLGGQSNTSLTAKPKIFRHFRKLKRKKLYCPIKHCVRIQIPRKGYFYRSTVQFKAPGCAPSMLCPQRMESNILPQSESKVQIPGLASASPKGPNLLKKRLKNNRKSDKPAPPRTPSSSPRNEHLGAVSSKEDVIHNLGRRVSGSGTSGFSPEMRPPSHKTKPPREASPSKTGRIRAVMENPVSCNKANSKTQIKRKSKNKSSKKVSSSGGTDGVSELLETSSEGVISRCKIGIKSPPPSDSSFETLISCISSVLGKDEGFYDLQISPVITGGGESSLESDIQMLANSPAPQSLQITEVVTAFEKYEDINSPDYLSPRASLTLQELNDGGDFGLATEDTIASMLIGEIDLHVELENYLRDIECFNGVRNRTKNTLQCSLCEDLHPLSDCFDLQNRTNEFFEMTEIKSNSTFASATSVCTQQDGDTDKLRMFADINYDMASEEYFDSRNTKMFISETQVTDKVGDIRKIKSDNDPKKLLQDSKLKNSIKRTFGNTSFQSSRPGEEKWALPPLQSDHSTDSYEKILPFGWHPNRTCDEVTNQSDLLQSNSSAETLPTHVKKSASKSDGGQKRSEPVEKVGSCEPLVPQQTPKSPEDSSFEKMITRAIPQLQSKRRRVWSPSMKELIEIYNSILLQNKKIRSNSRNSVNRCISSHLLSFLKKELKEKECKANLVMLASDLKRNLKTPRVWKPGRRKNDKTLEEYVTMFQEILRSSLSIDQITRLNNIISSLQESSEKNYDLVKNMNVIRKEDNVKKTDFPRLGTTKSESPKPKSAQEKALSSPVKPRKPSPKEKPIGPIQPSSPQCKLVRKKSEVTTPNKKEEIVPIEEITKIELTSPTELESILQSCFAADDIVGTRRRDSRDKILVTVKLRGNQVLVSKLTYFKNERSLSPGRTEENGTSQLIIENVTKDQIKPAPPKNKKSGALRQSIKIPEPKIAKPETKPKPVLSKKVKKRPRAMAKARTAKKDSYIERFCNSFFSKEAEQPKPSQPFEYDQMLLRTQHPIEAIIERSESRLSEHIESSDEDLLEKPQLEAPPERKILLKDVHTKTALKEALMDNFGESVNLKELTCDFTWNDEKTLDKSLGRAKSYVINRETLKKQTIAHKSPNSAEAVRSLTDLTSKPKSRKKVRRKANTYLCFPSILNMQKKPPLVKKKTKKQPKQKSRFLQSNSALDSLQEEVTKESSRETSSITESMSSLTEMPPDPDSAMKLPESEKEVRDRCSMELLYYDSENPSANVSPKVSASVVKTASKTTLSEQAPLPSEEKAPPSHGPSVLAVEGVRESPIVIHPPRNNSDDTIFHSVMIHSDSFLKKCYSSLALTQANLNSFLKACSDVKFCPGRANSSDMQQNPFVKFMLTPSQNANAGLPPNLVQIVDKKLLPAEDAVVEHFNKERPESSSTGINEKISLPSIERFIRKLSRGKKKGKAKFEDHKKAQPTAPRVCQKKKSFLSDHHPKTTDRKPYHECQKRKLNDKAKVPVRKTKTADSKTKLNREKPQPEPSEKNSETLLFFKKFIFSLSQVMESFSAETIKNSKSLELDPMIEGMSREGHVEKATNTTLEIKTSLMTLSASTADTPPRTVQLVKSAVTQTEDPPSARDRAEGGCEGELGRRRVRDNAGCTPKLATPPRRSKTLKIKIHCDDRSTCKDDSKAEKTWQQEAESPVPVEGELQRFNERIGLLDSLVMGEPEGGSLERRNSVYYDAVEAQSDEESEDERTEGRTGNSQQEFLTHWATVDPVHLNGGLGKEKSHGDASALMPSNSTLPEISSERMFEEILRSVQEDKICRSLTLLDDFLGKTELSASWSRNSDKLRNVLLLVCSKSINLMIGMEKSAWLKVLFLLEDITQKFGGSEDDSSRDSRKAFVGRIQKFNDSRLVDLQNCCVSLSQTAIGSNGRTNKFFRRIKDSFAYLRNRISPQRSHSANSIQSTSGAVLRSVDQPDRNPLHHLRKQIQKQKSYIEFLLTADCGTCPQEIQDVEEKVVEKMKSVGSILSLLSEG